MRSQTLIDGALVEKNGVGGAVGGVLLPADPGMKLHVASFDGLVGVRT